MKLLIVEDEIRISQMIQQGLITAGYEAIAVESAEEALEQNKTQVFDAFVIDISLPGKDGLELCRILRDKGTKVPILLLTARDKVSDKICGLDAGADDYMTKPFDFGEFTARVRALIRKSKGYERPIINIGNLLIDPNQKIVKRGTELIELSRKEFALLEFMARNQDQLLTRPMITHTIWDNESSSYTNIIDVFIAALRKKIDCEPNPKLIHTIRGRGFMLSEKPPA